MTTRMEPCPRQSCNDGLDTGSIPKGAADCRVCRGSGQVYPAGTVERIGTVTTDPRWAHVESPLLMEFAIAVLEAFDEKVPEWQ